MKKIVALLAVTALLLSMTACGSKETQPQTTAPTAQSTAASTQPSTQESTTATATEPEAQFQEILLADNENVLVKITGVENDPIWGYSLKVFIENKTELELMFTVQNVSVNGFMCDPFWAMSVDGGKKSNTTISWLESAFEENGIQSVEEITFTLRAYDSNDWLAEDVFNETITLNF